METFEAIAATTSEWAAVVYLISAGVVAIGKDELTDEEKDINTEILVKAMPVLKRINDTVFCKGLNIAKLD